MWPAVNDITHRLNWLRARPLRTLIPSLAAFATLTVLLVREPFALSTNAAQAVSGVSIWSVILIIIANRAGHKFLCSKDYVNLQNISTYMLINAGSACIVAFGAGIQDRALLGLSILSVLPCFAIATIARRALFSPEEWKAGARDER